MQLIIGNYNYSSWSMRPWLFVDYHALPVEVVKMHLTSEALLSRLRQHFSDGKVPLLVTETGEIWDSLAILEFLGERYPQTHPWPIDSEARAVARSVSAEMHSSFNALRTEVPMNCRRYYPGLRLSQRAQREVQRISEVWSYCRVRFGGEGPWLFGSFSIADAMFAPVVMRFRSVDIELTEDASAYCETVSQSASVKKWIEMALNEPETIDAAELDLPSQILKS